MGEHVRIAGQREKINMTEEMDSVATDRLAAATCI